MNPSMAHKATGFHADLMCNSADVYCIFSMLSSVHILFTIYSFTKTWQITVCSRYM